jgi:hypothetical protein
MAGDDRRRLLCDPTSPPMVYPPSLGQVAKALGEVCESLISVSQLTAQTQGSGHSGELMGTVVAAFAQCEPSPDRTTHEGRSGRQAGCGRRARTSSDARPGRAGTHRRRASLGSQPAGDRRVAHRRRYADRPRRGAVVRQHRAARGPRPEYCGTAKRSHPTNVSNRDTEPILILCLPLAAAPDSATLPALRWLRHYLSDEKIV